MNTVVLLLSVVCAAVQTDLNVFEEAIGVKCTSCSPTAHAAEPILSFGSTSEIECAVSCTYTNFCASFAVDGDTRICNTYRLVGGSKDVYILHRILLHVQQGKLKACITIRRTPLPSNLFNCQLLHFYSTFHSWRKGNIKGLGIWTIFV